MALARRRQVRVPASSANLGPGFDAFAAALTLHLELEVAESEDGFAVICELPGVALDRSNLVVRAFERLHPADGLRFEIRSEIPLCGGLGASAAAIVAGLSAADHLYELDADVLSLAADLEGHPDNVAAAVLGGFVICSQDGGPPHRFDPPVGLEAVLVLPQEAVRTSAARGLLPEQVPLVDAVWNTAHGAMLMIGLTIGDWDLVARGLSDRLHEPRRAPLVPRSYALARRAREFGARGATISGAGPAVLVWCQYDWTGSVIDALRAETAGWASLLRVPFEMQGAYVSRL
ncbi:MAG: homoserine kinase [Solirubrobacteraceae bacterium]